MIKTFMTLGLALAGLVLCAQNQNDGHRLTALWKQYEQAAQADLPQKEAAVLAQIKQQALQQHLPEDFWDAATLYVRTVQRRDWKQREPLRQALKEEVAQFQDPLITFLWMEEWDYARREQLMAYFKEHAEGFRGRHPAFYKNLYYLGGTLPEFIRDDAEYVLWHLLSSGSPEGVQALKDCVQGRYPNQAALDYWQAQQLTDPAAKSAALQEVASRYAGKAAALFPRADLLWQKKQELDQAGAKEGEYKTLYNNCENFEKQRAAFTGAEARIAKACNSVESLLQSLTAPSIQLCASQQRIQVLLRNMPGAKVTLYQGKEALQSWKLDNPARRFYVQDTLTAAMPVLKDGRYELEAVGGKESARFTYRQYTLSLATRTDARGHCVYVADYATGAPLDQATLVLKKGEEEVARAAMKLDGFTPLPEALMRPMKNSARYNLEAEAGDRRSQQVTLQKAYEEPRPDTSVRCLLYKDRGAYNPGDTLRFKAVLYEGDPSLALRVCKGKRVEVLLRDAEDKILEKQTLTTGAFGSVSGSFVLPQGLRNGHFSLEVKDLARDYFRVDEFVLPTFELLLDGRDSLYLAGDSVPVSGKVVSYSGHNLTGATARLQVQLYGETVMESSQPLEAGGSFHFRVKALRSGYYGVQVTVVDATGEPLSAWDAFYIGDALEVETTVEESADADWQPRDDAREWTPWQTQRAVVQSDTVSFRLQALDGAGGKVPQPVSFRLLCGAQVVAEGRAASGERVSVRPQESGLYLLEAVVSAQNADGKEIVGKRKCQILVIKPGTRQLDAAVRRVFVAGPTKVDGRIEALLGTAEGDAYAVVTLFGKGRQVLESRQVRVKDGSLQALTVDYKASYPDAVRLQVFYFLKDQTVCFDREYRRARTRVDLPLSFTRFTDRAYPGSRCSVTLQTAPDVEALAAVWDKSLDAVSSNDWPVVTLSDVSVPYVPVSSAAGHVTAPDDSWDQPLYSIHKTRGGVNLMASKAAVAEEAVAMNDAVALESGAAEVPVRSVFSSALTFQPHLRPAADGTLRFDFATSDKLSTYYVRVWAHNADMGNALVQRELVVSLPVKVALQEPRFLYDGDLYEAAVTVSSVADEAVSGLLTLSHGDTQQQIPVTVPAGGTVTRRFAVRATTSELTLTAAFRSDAFSDAVRVNVPVYPAAQALTEAHSAVLLDGMDREALLRDLRSRFVNVPAASAVLQERSVLEMVRAAIPSHADPAGPDILSLTEAWYVRLLASNAPADPLLPRILACRSADGGFAWFEGMDPSPVLTAVVLERAAKLRDRGFDVPALDASVRWLDQVQFLGAARPVWRGALSDAQYMHVRALYAHVPFQVTPVTEADKDRLAAFRKAAKAYLLPSAKDGRGMQGRILAKARRLLTLRSLLERPGGDDLAGAWGVTRSRRCLQKSLQADLASLLEYAVPHRDGGWYYPNAVLPWRGLLESEAYAHSLLCDLLSHPAVASAVADGIRLWLMLQKETQHWDADPAFVDAITSILDGSQAVLNTRVLVLSAAYEAPFEAVQAAGNGFTVERQFLRNGAPLQPGDPLSVGDRITVRYAVWSAENRSFVRLTAAREAALRPVQQLSGAVGYGWLRPWSAGYAWTFTPQGYRNVKAACTEYYFDSYPEERTVLEEEFYVTQAGTFRAPVVVIESLYSPHYRANSAYLPPLLSQA